MAKMTKQELVDNVNGLHETYLIARQRHSQTTRNYHSFHVSAMGKCLRMMQYQRYIEEGKMPSYESKDKKS